MKANIDNKILEFIKNLQPVSSSEILASYFLNFSFFIATKSRTFIPFDFA